MIILRSEKKKDTGLDVPPRPTNSFYVKKKGSIADLVRWLVGFFFLSLLISAVRREGI